MKIKIARPPLIRRAPYFSSPTNQKRTKGVNYINMSGGACSGPQREISDINTINIVVWRYGPKQIAALLGQTLLDELLG